MHSNLTAIFDRDAFTQYLEKVNQDMWNMYNNEAADAARVAQVIAGQDGEPTIWRDDAEDELELVGEEYEAYLDDWVGNMPPDIFEALALRRSARLKAAWDEAAAAHDRAIRCHDEAYWQLWETLPMDRKVEASDDLHLAALWAWVERVGWACDAATRAYNNR